MSKAFTKEDDDSGFTAPASLAGLPVGPFRITATGASLAAGHADARVRDTLGHADVLPPVTHPERASLGVTVVVETTGGETRETRRYRLVSAAERALVADGCSVDGPIGRVLLGSEVGDVREVSLPRGAEELEVVALEGEKPQA